ncbi:hypothetical protein BJ986_000192 [Phycicoccus badiiscoriae]|uniref:Uncharacterized protein n=1 Tax=Pedococcus badiiscoriae TaxID=642776 RepID=A0A852WHG6_9MICO|nr:hypothetical protein [Pedococcus badiiscoriae]NYG05705.1 hypothetical protein [Pedococcus badiiscoriae]
MTIIRHTDAERVSETTDFWEQVFLTEDGQINLGELRAYCGIKSRATTITTEQARELSRMLTYYANLESSSETGAGFARVMGEFVTAADLADEAGLPAAAVEAWWNGEAGIHRKSADRLMTVAIPVAARKEATR